MNLKSISCVLAVSFSCCLTDGFADGCLQRNPPGSTEGETKSPCGCSGNGGDDAEVSDDCIKVMLGMGRSTPWTGSQPLALKVFADDSSPMVFTPDSLYPIMGYTFKRLGNAVLSDGVTAAEVVFSHPNGEPVHFVFKEGESLGRPDPGVHVPMDERLQMVDAQGWATDHDPVYWDLYETEGSVRRFLASDLTGRRGSLVSVTDSRGLVTIPGDMGVDLVYGPDGVRQFLTPSRLADVRVVRDGYDVAIYPLQSAPAKDPATGLYPVPDVPTHRFLSVRSANGGKQAVVTLKTGESDPKRYVFDYVSGDWSLTRPNGVREIKDRVTDDSSKARLSKEVRSSDNTLISKSVMNYKWESWGYAMTNKVEGFGGVTQTTSWTYYTSGGGTGKVKTSLSPTGLLTEYAYDDEGREQSIRRSSPDMMTELTTYSYVSVDPSDVAPPVDTRPRTVVKTLDGIECERTYYIYSPLTNIVERVGTQGAPYGSTNALRTVTAFYPTEVGAAGSAARVGRVASIRHEDGRLDLYDYALTDGIWAETVTHLHEQSPEPVSGKTTRDTTLTNRRGETIERKTEAFIDGSWYTIARDRMTYNTTGKRIRTENLAGQATVTDWDCCHKVSETGPDGSTTTWDYDEEGRMVASSRLVPLDMTNVTWLTTCYQYDALGRQVATWQTNYAAQVGLPATRTRYDQLGRVIARVDTLGNITTTEYSPDGRTVFVRNPNTSTRVLARSASGSTLSITGTAVTPEFHTYGILPDGTRWHKTVEGETANSPRFTKRYENMLGATIRGEESGFEGAFLATSYGYDGYGRRTSQASEGEPALRQEYDIFGEASSSTIQINASEWRRSDFNSYYELRGTSVWWMAETVGSCSDENIADRRQTEAKRISGVSRMLLAESQKVDMRGNVSTMRIEYSGSLGTVQIGMTPEKSAPDTALFRFGMLVRSGSGSRGDSFVVYDELGRRCATIDGSGKSSRCEYDQYGRCSAEIDADGNRIAYGYDAFGRMVSLTNALGEVRRFEYDIRGRKVFDGGSMHSTRFAYDVFDNTVSMINYRDGQDAVGDETRWVYDAASGKLASKMFANGKGPEYFYNANGLCTRRVWARGVETTYGYNCWGDLVRTEYSDGTPTVVRAYDVLGRLTNVLDAAGTTTYEYNAVGDLHRVVVDAGEEQNTVEHYHDEYGRSLGYSLDGIRQSTLAYDPASGRLVSMEAVGSPTPFAWSYHDGSGFKSALAYPNGLTVAWNYGRRGELMDVDNACITGAVSRFAYGYDAVGRRVSCARSGMVFSDEDTYSYFYNSCGELTNAVATLDSDYQFEYEFDGAGNRIRASERGVSVEYFADQLNQYTNVVTAADNGFVPTFDDDGNQTLVKTSTGIWSVVYNGENRPIRWTCIQSGSPSITNNQTIAMAYDFLGRRVKKGNWRFVYNGYNQIADNGGNVYVWDPSAGASMRPLVWKRGNDVLYYTHDGNKNVSEVVAANCDVAAHYEYAPFGAVVTQQGVFAAANPWRFSSEYVEDDIGLVYYNFRHYDPAAGRWLSREEFAIDAQNHYEYLSNRPTTTTDHLGLYDERVHFYLMYILMNELLEDDLDDDSRHAKALEIAKGSQYPDSRKEFNAMYNRAYHETLHNLNDLTCCDLEKYKQCIACNLKKQGDPFLKGVYLHVLADTFSHVRFKIGKDGICSYSPGIGHFFDGTKPDDPQFGDIGKDRLDKLIKEIEGLFGKKISPDLKAFLDKLQEKTQKTRLVKSGRHSHSRRSYMANVYDFGKSVRNLAEKRGLPENEDFENPYGEESFWDKFSEEGRARNKEINQQYETRDKAIRDIVVPELEKCLKKEGECAK